MRPHRLSGHAYTVAQSYFSALTRRGLFQYGLLHFGQTRGSCSMSRGTHSCSQRSQRKPQTVIFTFGMIEVYTS